MFFFNEDSTDPAADIELTVYKVMQPQLVLSHKEIKKQLDELKSLVKLPEQIWVLVYVKMIESFIQFCQHIPLDQSSEELYFYQRIKRALTTLQFYAPLIRQNKGFGHDEDRLIFAFFSAAMLSGIGRIFQDYSLYQVNESGQYQYTWFPNVKPLSGFYKRRIRTAQSNLYVAQMHINYALLILPNEAAAWLMEDQALYVMWVNALVDFQQGFDRFDIDVGLKQERSSKEVVDLNLENDQLTPDEMTEVEKFWAWLKKSAANAKDARALKALGIEGHESSYVCDIDRLVEQYAKNHKTSIHKKINIKRDIEHLGVGVVESDLLVIEKDSGSLPVLSTVAAAQSQSHIGAPERFFSRVAGIATQFMQAYTQQGSSRQ
jgi:hypothetical protein